MNIRKLWDDSIGIVDLSKAKAIVAMLLLVAVIPFTVYLAQKEQTIQQHAAYTGACRDMSMSDAGTGSIGPDSDFRWKALPYSSPCTMACTNNTQCPGNTQQPNKINPNTSGWCYGFDNGTTPRCIQLEYIGSNNAPTPVPTQPQSFSGGLNVNANPSAINQNGSTTVHLTGGCACGINIGIDPHGGLSCSNPRNTYNDCTHGPPGTTFEWQWDCTPTSGASGNYVISGVGGNGSCTASNNYYVVAPTPTPIPQCGPSNATITCTTCSYPPNTCGTTNGTGTDCSYTGANCVSTFAPNQPHYSSCSQDNCNTGSSCVSNVCVSPTPTPTLLPSQTPTPTISPTPPPGSTPLSISASLVGIGSGGPNNNPQHRTRQITVCLYPINPAIDPSGDSNCAKLPAELKKNGTVTYDSNSGNFINSSFDMGTGVTTGSYLVYMWVDGFLRVRASDIPIAITSGVTPPQVIPTVTEQTGDINKDNIVDIRDYNLLVQFCYGQNFSAATCPFKTGNNTSGGFGFSGADINDDGKTDGVDYNLMVRALSALPGE